MNFVRIITLIIIVSSVGCASTNHDVSMPLNGTDAAVVKIFIDARSGEPRVSENFVKVERGQRVVWVGPDDFTIAFPKGSPFPENQFSTENSVINLMVPRVKQQESAKGKETSYKYDVIANGKVLDPHMIIIEQ